MRHLVWRSKADSMEVDSLSSTLPKSILSSPSKRSHVSSLGDSPASNRAKPHVRFSFTDGAVSDSEHGHFAAMNLEEMPVDQELPSEGDPVEGEDGESSSVSFPKLQKRIQTELSLRRMRGHVPFDSRCTHCVNTRSVVRHTREIHWAFCVLDSS